MMALIYSRAMEPAKRSYKATLGYSQNVHRRLTIFRSSILVTALSCFAVSTLSAQAHHDGTDNADGFPVSVNVLPSEHHSTVPAVTAPPPVFQLPLIAQPSIIVPTDVTGFHAGVSAYQRKPEQPLTKEELSVLTARDPRFEFTSEWDSFAGASSASLPGVLLGSSPDSNKQFGRVEKIVPQRKKYSEPVFMPTVSATFSKIDDGHLTLHDGAVLVRAGDRPVYVSTKLCHGQVVTCITKGAIALISAFDEKPTILNLTDRRCGAVFVYLPLEHANNTRSLSMKAGEIAEAYKLETKPTSYLVSSRIDINERIGPHCGLLVSQCHYIRAMKKFNLIAALPRNEFERIIKTAAAVAHVQGKR